MSRYKVMLLGEIGVGKSSLVRRLVLDRFEANYKPTLGVDIYTYNVPTTSPHDVKTTLMIWDTDGNFGEAMFQHVYMRQAHAALIVGDATRTSTLETMCALASGFRDNFPGRHHALIVNKIDLLPPNEAPKLPQALVSTPHNTIQTSAKTGDNVQAAFHDAAQTLARREA